jgi:hypothetical protein
VFGRRVAGRTGPTASRDSRTPDVLHEWYLPIVRIGVYIDGFNLYYGARGLCGRGASGWRWLDLRGLAVDLAGRRSNWPGAQIHRACTAPRGSTALRTRQARPTRMSI